MRVHRLVTREPFPKKRVHLLLAWLVYFPQGAPHNASGASCISPLRMSGERRVQADAPRCAQWRSAGRECSFPLVPSWHMSAAACHSQPRLHQLPYCSPSLAVICKHCPPGSSPRSSETDVRATSVVGSRPRRLCRSRCRVACFLPLDLLSCRLALSSSRLDCRPFRLRLLCCRLSRLCCSIALSARSRRYVRGRMPLDCRKADDYNG